MLRLFLSLLLLICSSPSFASDPFESLVVFELDNGIEVYLASSPTAKLTKIKVDVDVGWESEEAHNFGVSHLLEHVLFRDKSLKDDMSYLQLIREKGGDANGVTSNRLTTYFATIPHKRARWLHGTFFKMLTQQEELLDDYVQKEKETVLREIGEPMALNRVLGVDLWDMVRFKYLNLPTFWESEFGVSFENPFTREQERLSTLKLTQAQVKQHYDDYYYPENMRVYVSGRFDVQGTKSYIKSTWGKLPKRKGKKLKAIEEPKPREAPFYEIKVARDDAFVSNGTKIWDVNIREELILTTYLDFLAHRLMKEIRNKHGYTYHVSPDVTIYRRYGYARIGFYTKSEQFVENRKLLDSYIENEAQKGLLTADLVEEAKNLKIRYFEATDNDADSMMWVADTAFAAKRDYGVTESPYKILSSVQVDEFNATLKKYFEPKRRYTYLEKPPLFFKFDFTLLFLLVFAVSFRRYRRWLTQKFDHTQLKWARKIQYPPFKIVEIGATVVALLIYLHVQFVLQYGFSKLMFLQTSLLATQYIFWSVCVSLFALSIQGIYALCPRKIMIVGDQLFIKSMTYYSRKIPLADIESVSTESLFSYPFTIEFWKSVAWRFYYCDPFIWRRALVIHVKGGRAYLFSFRNSKKVAEELSQFLNKPSSEESVKATA